MVTTRSKIVSGLVGTLLALLLFGFVLYDDSYIKFAVPKIFSSTAAPIDHKVLPRLQGRLSPNVYTLFEQVYSDATPPPIDLYEVRRACQSSTYHPDLYLQCDLGIGGMSTLLTQIKSCLNMALWQGVNFVIPTTPSRSTTKLNDWDSTTHRPLGTWTDRDFLIEKVQEACPRIKFVLLDEHKQPDIEISETVQLNPCTEAVQPPFCTAYGPFAANDYDRQWKQHFEQQIDEVLQNRTSATGTNLIIKMPVTGMMFNKTSDAHVERQFYELVHMLRAVEPVRNIISHLVTHLFNSSGILQPYYGVHFRAEEDALGEIGNGWKTPEEQLNRVFQRAEEARVRLQDPENVNVIYLACGEQDKVDLFRARAKTAGWKVIDKWSIAGEIGSWLVRDIDTLDFDHMAMIDFAMLLISDFFIGTGESAFSYSIAHERHPRGRFYGNLLDFTASQLEARPDVAAARTHLFEMGDIGGGYQCCM